jgi:aryl carrier-like protein
MRIVKPDAKHHSHATPDGTDYPHYDVVDVIEVNLDDFREWYYQVWFRKDGGDISYKDVATLVQEWLDSVVFMSTDMENNNGK